MPAGWEEVESCSTWEQNRAEELIQQLPEGGEEVSEARSQFESGNYSEAITTALSALERQRNVEKQNPLAGFASRYLEVLLAAFSGFIVLVALLYRKHKKEKVLEEVEEHSEKLAKEIREKGGLTREEKKEFLEASKDLKNENYRDARDKLENINQ